MSSLINERPIVISPALAATIGLEEAILLSLLQDFALLRDRHQDWQEVLLEEVQQLAPFWDEEKCRQLADNLEQKGILHLETPKLQPKLRLRYSLQTEVKNSEVKSAAKLATPKPIKEKTTVARAQPLNTQWQPDEQTLKMLEKNHGITRDFALSQLNEFVHYWTERGESKHAWNNHFQKDILRKWRNREVEQAQTDKATALDYGWRPSDDAISILTRAGVDAEFLDEAIPEFVLYWRERGQASHTWNSKFIAHIRKQWAKYTAEMQTDGEPKLIEKNWQPSANVFDILKMANIDIAFGHAQVSEFILYWQERGEAHSAWNSKFLQHVKQQWAYLHKQQLRAEQADETQRQNSRSTADKRGFIEKHTDNSWADGL